MDHGLIYVRNWRDEGMFYQVGACKCGEPLSVTSALGPERVRRNLYRAYKTHIDRAAKVEAAANRRTVTGWF
jgi:hypothetical protein